MKIAIVSDTHHFQMIPPLIHHIMSQQCDYVIHCGDFDTRKNFNAFSSAFGSSLYFTIGNEDTYFSRMLSDQKRQCNGDIKFWNPYLKKLSAVVHEITLGGFRFALIHNTYPCNTLDSAIMANVYNFVVYGHLHYLNFRKPSIESKTWAINPGGFYTYSSNTYVLLDLAINLFSVYFYYASAFHSIIRLKLFPDTQFSLQFSLDHAFSKWQTRMTSLYAHLTKKKYLDTEWFHRYGPRFCIRKEDPASNWFLPVFQSQIFLNYK